MGESCPRCAPSTVGEPFLPSVITKTGLDTHRYICSGWFGPGPQPEPPGLHRRQELLGDREPGGVANHRVDPAARAQGCQPAVGPLPDVLELEHVQAPEAPAEAATQQFAEVPDRVLMRPPEVGLEELVREQHT